MSKFQTPLEALKALDTLLMTKPWSPCDKAAFLKNDFTNLRRHYVSMLEAIPEGFAAPITAKEKPVSQDEPLSDAVVDTIIAGFNEEDGEGGSDG